MAQQVKYKPTDRKNLIAFEWGGRGHGTGAVRALKMVRPICKLCYLGPDTPSDWHQKCEHDPYFSKKPHIKKVDIFEIQDVDGVDREVLTGTETRTFLVKEPNITEVVASVRSNDGQGPAKKRRYGFRELPEVGYAPMCEMYGCGKAWPEIGTAHGNYCSENHAKLCIADALEVKFTINRPELRRQEMQAVNI